MKRLLLSLFALAATSAFALPYYVGGPSNDATYVAIYDYNTPNDGTSNSVANQTKFPWASLPYVTFYKYNDGGSEDGTAASKFWVSEATDQKFEVKWTGTQPVLTYFMIKAGDGFTLWNVSSFNLGTYTSIIAENTLLTNKKGNAHGISHVQFEGRLGQTKVPDVTSTLALVGAALAGLVAFRRR
jgi:hypothetical protein